MSTTKPDCRHFTGYRPCDFGGVCDGCTHFERAEPDILLINLDALGDVLRNTSVIPAIRRAHPRARVTWLTRPHAAALLTNNPLIDRVILLEPGVDTPLPTLTFDLVLNADKTMVAGALAMACRASERRGFGIDSFGSIVALNPEAEFLYRMGLDDHLKFKVNQRSAQDLLCEAFGFQYARDPYTLEADRVQGFRRLKVGFNTGCGPKWPLKKIATSTVEAAIALIARRTGEPVLLLGGPEDTETHAVLEERLGVLVERSPTTDGLRAGVAQMDRVDVVVSGDSLGMHMAIALRKHVVAWFGPTSAPEIDLYNRGVKLISGMSCSPCWSPTCPEPVPCSARVSPSELAEAVESCLQSVNEEQTTGALAAQSDETTRPRSGR